MMNNSLIPSLLHNITISKTQKIGCEFLGKKTTEYPHTNRTNISIGALLQTFLLGGPHQC